MKCVCHAICAEIYSIKNDICNNTKMVYMNKLTRAKNRITLQSTKRRSKRGGMFENQISLLPKLRRSQSVVSMPLSSYAHRNLIAMAGPLVHLSKKFFHNSTFKSVMQNKMKLNQMRLMCLESANDFRKNNDFENAARMFGKAIGLGSLPARAELASLILTGRINSLGLGEPHSEARFMKVHELVYGANDPDCKGVLALLYLYTQTRAGSKFSILHPPPNDPAFIRSAQHGWNFPWTYALPLAEESSDAKSKYGILALGRYVLLLAHIDNLDFEDTNERIRKEEGKKLHDKQLVSELNVEAEQLRAEAQENKQNGIRLMLKAANPPYNYDYAQFACSQLPLEDGGDPKYHAMATAQGWIESWGERGEWYNLVGLR